MTTMVATRPVICSECPGRLRSCRREERAVPCVLHHDSGHSEGAAVRPAPHPHRQCLEEGNGRADRTHGHTAAHQQQEADTKAQADSQPR